MSSRHRARPLSTQTRGPYTVRPWSCCCEKRPCFIKLPGGHRSLPTTPRRPWCALERSPHNQPVTSMQNILSGSQNPAVGALTIVSDTGFRYTAGRAECSR
jgi:hypothetical protein